VHQYTYNVPRQSVDGQPGWIHSGLNPEVLDKYNRTAEQVANPEAHATALAAWAEKVDAARQNIEPVNECTSAEFWMLCGAVALFLLLTSS